MTKPKTPQPKPASRQELYDMLFVLVGAVKDCESNWEEGNLAAAMNNLSGYKDEALKLLRKGKY